MHSSSRPSVPARSRRLETNRKADPKSQGPGTRKEDKNMNSTPNTTTSSTRRVTRGPPESSRLRLVAQAGRKPAVKPTVARQQKNTTQSGAANPKPKNRRAVSNLPPVVADPNCNEPSLPCLCCDGRSPQDSNSLFNHNHNNNNTITMRQQLQLQQPSKPHKEDEAWQRKPEVEAKAETKPDCTVEEKAASGPVAQVEEQKEEILLAEDKEKLGEEDSDIEVAVGPGVDPNGNDQVAVEEEEDDDDDDDDDTLVPSCCDCPASMLEFSLSCSTSSSSTSISSCSDLELDCPDTYSLSSQDQDIPERYPPSHSPTAQPHILPLNPNTPMDHPLSPCSPDEGYPSAPSSPSSDFAGSKGQTGQCGTKSGLLHFLDSMDELGKMDRFYHVVQVVCWDLDDEMGLRDRLDHLYRLEKVNRQVKLFHLAKLQDAGLELDEEDFSDMLDEMGNIDIPWKLYQSDSSCDSQEFSDAGVDVTGPSDLDEPVVPDSLTSSPLEPPPRPPKPPVRHVSTQPETHTYINISRSSPAASSTTSPRATAVSSLSPSSHKIKKPIPDPPPLPPPPSQAIPYFTLYSASPCAPTPTPPIPPPRTRHLARREALRCAQLLAESTPLSLPAPTSKPPPLPPPPTLPSPPKIPPPPSLPPPPSFHALDVEIHKLLALAGLTQAELLKLSPELGVCVGGALDSSQGEKEEVAAPEPEPVKISHRRDSTNISGDRASKYDTKGMEVAWTDGWGEAGKFGEHRGADVSQGEHTYGDRIREAKRDTLGTTSFTDMARRRKQNGGSVNSGCSCGYSANASLSTESYYTTDLCNTNSTKVTFENFDYSSEMPDTPPPPPPRPLPPCPPVTSKPPKLPPLKPCTVPANAARPDRFDWLIAFTPETEELRKSTSGVIPPRAPLGSKVTTFKELRNRSKQSSQAVYAEPEPDLSIVTPDPDFLYNLKWRRQKQGGDDTQWEYTSQAEACLLMPPPTPASLSLFREMRHLTLEGDGQAEPHPSQRIGCSISAGNLWNMGREREGDGQQREEEDEEEEQVRGRADGGRTLESRTTVSSPPLSLARPQAPPSTYFLHSFPMPPPLLMGRQGLHRAQPGSSTRCQESLQTKTSPTSDSVSQTYPDSLYCSKLNHSVDDTVFLNDDVNSNLDSLYLHDNISKSNLDSLYCYSNGPTTKIDNGYHCKKDSLSNMDSLLCTHLNCNVDSLYHPQSEGMKSDLTRNNGVDICNDGNTTPYKNIEMLSYAHKQKAQSYPHSSKQSSTDSQHVMTPYQKSDSCIPWDSSLDQMKSLGSVEMTPPPLPTCYLYHPKNCPMHKGAPPRLSPVGALSPPYRPGLPGPGVDTSGLCSPLFPRSHTLPALAAPLYYPYLYTPPIRALVQEPPTPNLTKQTPRPRALTVRSLSFAGSVQRAGAWMGDDDDASFALKGVGLSSQCLQEKRALVSAVSLAVEAILAQFSSSRTLVQKALSGDSSINPALGRLVLQCLCPALRTLLSDGLKPHQSDLIAGRRPNSPWGLVQASTKPGPSTQGLHSLQCRVAELPQLRQSRHRFNSFLLGLLNIKLLDYWISHLQTCSDVLLTYYRPNSFMRLSLTSCQPLFEELLLLLQPLSLLTFNLDLLFQHHHLDPASPADTPANHSPDLHSPPNQDLGFRVSSQGLFLGRRLESVLEHDVGRLESDTANQSKALSSLSKPLAGGVVQSASRGPVPVLPFASHGETSPQLQWVREKGIAPPLDDSGHNLSQQAGQAIQQGWGAVVRWGERLGQNLSSLGSSNSEASEDVTTGMSPDTRREPGVLRSHPQEEVSPWASSVAVPWGLERLFGASKSPSNPPSLTTQARRPSQWLAPGVSVLTRMVSSHQPALPDRIHVETKRTNPAEKERQETQDKPKGTRAVRTLCDHSGSGAELSFQKGEELIVLGSVDQDWIRCRQGEKEGLVPIGYASLIL